MKNIFFLLLFTQLFASTSIQNFPSDITQTSSETSDSDYSSESDYSTDTEAPSQIDVNENHYSFTGNFLNNFLGNGISNIVVTLFSNHQQIEQTRSDDTGFFEFIGIPPDEQLCEISFTLPFSLVNAYSGRISNSFQQPFANIPIDIIFPNGEELHLTTSAQGEYSFMWEIPDIPCFFI